MGAGGDREASFNPPRPLAQGVSDLSEHSFGFPPLNSPPSGRRDYRPPHETPDPLGSEIDRFASTKRPNPEIKIAKMPQERLKSAQEGPRRPKSAKRAQEPQNGPRTGQKRQASKNYGLLLGMY